MRRAPGAAGPGATARLRAGFLLAPAVLALIWLALAALPDASLRSFTGRPYSLTFTDRNGVPLRTLPVEDGLMREYAALDDLPPLLVSIFQRSEDQLFYAHPGVDPVSVARAAIQNARAGRVVSGGSTLSMQLARLIRPHDGGFAGKIRESTYALRLEAQLSKAEILELWLNSIPFGSGTEGVRSAARTFFSAGPGELSVEQILLLAVIPRRPALYDPRRSPDRASEAAVQLADRIGVPVTPERVRRSAASAATGPAGTMRGPATDLAFEAPHFVRRAAAELAPGRWSDGSPVRTTIDLAIQHGLEAAIRARVVSAERYRIGTGAGLVVDNGTGAILAYVGSADFSDVEASGQIDGVRIRRQPGSTLKPFLYALALEQGFTAATVLPDVPMEFGGPEIYVPENFNRRFNGPVRLRTALASSLNVPAVYTIERLGVASFAEYLVSLGFSSIADQRDSVGTGLALGNAEVSLEELVRAFTVFARGGTLPALHWNPEQTLPAVRVIDGATAAIIRSILSDQPARVPGFGTRSVLDASFEAIVKTGTSSQFNNIWALGSSAGITVGVWMGNFGGQTVIGAPGSSLPAAAVMEVLALFTAPGSDLPPPEGVHEVEICATSGMRATPDCPAVIGEIFTPGSEPQPCTWHTGGSLVRYPPQFQSWALERNYAVDVGPSGAVDDAGVNIIRPADGAVFYLDPTIAPGDQAVPVEVIAGGGPIQLYVDDAFIAEGRSPLLVLLPLRQGSARITAVSEGRSDMRSITIR